MQVKRSQTLAEMTMREIEHGGPGTSPYHLSLSKLPEKPRSWFCVSMLSMASNKDGVVETKIFLN
jgi:hypothetical protein